MVTVDCAEMVQLAEDLMEGGAGMVENGRGIADADEPIARAQMRRAYAREIAAGMAILDQIEQAAREAA